MSIALHLKVRVRFNDQEYIREYIRLVQLDRYLPDDIDQAAINEAMETVRGLGPNPSRYAYKVVSVDDGVAVQVVPLDSMDEKTLPLPLSFDHELCDIKELTFFADSLVMAMDRARTAIDLLYLHGHLDFDITAEVIIRYDGHAWHVAISFQEEGS